MGMKCCVPDEYTMDGWAETVDNTHKMKGEKVLIMEIKLLDLIYIKPI